MLGLDDARGAGWNLAATMWAEYRARKPAVVIEDADLLIAATALFHDRTLVTTDARLAENLKAIAFAGTVTLLPAD